MLIPWHTHTHTHGGFLSSAEITERLIGGERLLLHKLHFCTWICWNVMRGHHCPPIWSLWGWGPCEIPTKVTWFSILPLLRNVHLALYKTKGKENRRDKGNSNCAFGLLNQLRALKVSDSTLIYFYLQILGRTFFVLMMQVARKIKWSRCTRFKAKYFGCICGFMYMFGCRGREEGRREIEISVLDVVNQMDPRSSSPHTYLFKKQIIQNYFNSWVRELHKYLLSFSGRENISLSFFSN